MGLLSTHLLNALITTGSRSVTDEAPAAEAFFSKTEKKISNTRLLCCENRWVSFKLGASCGNWKLPNPNLRIHIHHLSLSKNKTKYRISLYYIPQ